MLKYFLLHKMLYTVNPEVSADPCVIL